MAVNEGRVPCQPGKLERERSTEVHPPREPESYTTCSLHRVEYSSHLWTQRLRYSRASNPQTFKLASLRKTQAMPNDATTRLLYAILSQKCLKDVSLTSFLCCCFLSLSSGSILLEVEGLATMTLHPNHPPFLKRASQFATATYRTAQHHDLLFLQHSILPIHHICRCSPSQR